MFDEQESCHELTNQFLWENMALAQPIWPLVPARNRGNRYPPTHAHGGGAWEY